MGKHEFKPSDSNPMLCAVCNMRKYENQSQHPGGWLIDHEFAEAGGGCFWCGRAVGYRLHCPKKEVTPVHVAPQLMVVAPPVPEPVSFDPPPGAMRVPVAMVLVDPGPPSAIRVGPLQTASSLPPVPAAPPAPQIIYVYGRPRGATMPCGWGCGADLTSTEMRKHFRTCPRRPDGGKA